MVLVSETRLNELITQLEISNNMLKTHKRILEQEKKRWQTIHSNPVTDKVTLVKGEKEGEYIITSVIDTGVNNEVNSHPITRKTVMTIDNDRGPFFDSINLNLMAWASYSHGITPAVSVCYSPPFIKSLIGHEIGIGAYTNLITSGLDIEYRHRVMKRVSLHITVGSGMDRKVVPGIAIGVRF